MVALGLHELHDGLVLGRRVPVSFQADDADGDSIKVKCLQHLQMINCTVMTWKLVTITQQEASTATDELRCKSLSNRSMLAGQESM